MRYHLTFVRMAIIKNTAYNKYWQGCGEKGNLVPCWQEYKLLQPLGKQYGGPSKNYKQNYHTIQQFHFWIFFQGKQNSNLKRYMHPYVHCSIIHNSKIWKQPKCPSIYEWIKKMWCVCMCVCIYICIQYMLRILLSHERE